MESISEAKVENSQPSEGEISNVNNLTEIDKDKEKKVERECDNCLKKGYGFPKCSKCKVCKLRFICSSSVVIET